MQDSAETIWLERVIELRDGYEPDAVDRFTDRLVRLAGSRSPNRLQRRVDAEDIVWQTVDFGTDTETIDAIWHLGVLHGRQGNWLAEKKACEEILKIDPTNGSATARRQETIDRINTAIAEPAQDQHRGQAA